MKEAEEQRAAFEAWIQGVAPKAWKAEYDLAQDAWQAALSQRPPAAQAGLSEERIMKIANSLASQPWGIGSRREDGLAFAHAVLRGVQTAPQAEAAAPALTAEPGTWAWRAFDPDEGHDGTWGPWRVVSYKPPRAPDSWFQVVELPNPPATSDVRRERDGGETAEGGKHG